MKQPILNSSVVDQPAVMPLSRVYRTIIFVLCVLLFIVCVPIFVFYATGYRFDIFQQEKGIIITGGLYVGTQIDRSEIYINNELVRGSRLFRRGIYIQNVSPGVQQVHVQADGLQTWVKKVPISPYIVTEVEAFLMPETPQLRVITEYLDSSLLPVLNEKSSALVVLENSTSTQNFVLASTTLQKTYIQNPEYMLMDDLFTPATTSAGAVNDTRDEGVFRFFQGEMQEVIPATTTVSTTTLSRGGMVLFEKDGQLFARYVGPARIIPNYFCVPTATVASTSELFGIHVAHDIERKLMGPVQVSAESYDTNERLCRAEIRIDTKSKTPLSFYFLPNVTDYVLVHTDDGVFVVEIDDRAWQNVQQVYPASAEQVIVDNNRIYIKEDDVYFELYTTLLTS